MNSKKILIFVLPAILSIGLVAAQTSISGDSLCGSDSTTACNFTHLKQLVKGVMFFIIGLGLPLLVVVVAYRMLMAWFQVQQGNANAYREALKKVGQSILGFLILILLFGGALTVLLTYLGATEPVMKLLKLIATAFVPVANAQEMLPSPVADTNLYDFVLKILSLIMRFFIYPGLIVMWVLTGFSFIFAQGKPDALTKAKKLLMWAFVSTFIVMFIQAFLMAARGTVEQILPGSTTQTAGGTGVARGGTCNAGATCQSGLLCHSGTCSQAGDVCTKTGGTYGQVTTDNQCQ